MGAESPNRGGAQTESIFLSYASQDVRAARRICDALRAAAIEVCLVFPSQILSGSDYPFVPIGLTAGGTTGLGLSVADLRSIGAIAQYH
jgi:hypothetical protein